MIVLVDSTAEAELMTRALASACRQLGANAPTGFLKPTIVVIGEHPRAPGAWVGAPYLADVDDAPMSFREAAQAIGASTSTVGRLARQGRLTKVGRRITTPSVRAYLEGSR